MWMKSRSRRKIEDERWGEPFFHFSPSQPPQKASCLLPHLTRCHQQHTKPLPRHAMSEADPDWKAKLRESLKESEQFDKMISWKRRGRSNKKNSSTKNKNSISSIKFDKKFSSSTRSKTTVSSDDVTQKISFTNSSSSSTSSSTSAYSSKVAKGNVSSSSKENISNNKKPTTQKPKRAFGRRLLGGRLLGGKAIRRTGLGGPLAVIEEDENDENETTATISETHAARESTFSPALPYPPAPSSVNKLVVVKEAEEQEQPKDDKEVEFLEDTAPTKKQLLFKPQRILSRTLPFAGRGRRRRRRRGGSVE